MARNTNSLSLGDPYPKPTVPHLKLVEPDKQVVGTDDAEVEIGDGVLTIRHSDGSVTVDFGGGDKIAHEDSDEFTANLAKQLEEGRLDEIAEDLMEAIDADDRSRQDWLETRAQGIEMLGLKIEKPRADGASGSAPVEGQSTVRHPLLLESTISFQATARAELLPATGPVKVRNDAPSAPRNLQVQQTNAQKELINSIQGKDDLADALETDMNHWLTTVATEYIPDTDRMLFYVGFGGDGFKKVYNCPIRRRPVSESVDAEDLIVSNAATDLHSCSRVTHRITMRRSVLRRMQILGVYLDVDLDPPPVQNPNPVDQKNEEIQGIKTSVRRPEDNDYEIYETYCELELDEFAPKQFKGKKLPLPYRVTIERNTRKILDIRRNWKEDDEQCNPKRYFVQYPFVRGLGFYGLGFIHILGNTTNTLTAAWRLILDNGMFANFPAFLFAKGAGRQNTNLFRLAPGSGQPIDVGANASLKDSVMPLPYREAGAGFTAFISHVEEAGRRLGAVADVAVGEGKQEAPVGTTLALIEQATKVIDSAHKRLHAAQAEEFMLLKERFREDPESFWRHNPNASIDWRKDQFLTALQDYDLVPVADPNNPTSLHRVAKAMALKELQKGSPDLYDPVAVDMRVMRIVGIDPQGLFRATPPPPPPDPRMEAIKQKAQQQDKMSQIALLQAQIKAATAYAQMEDKEKDRQSRERIAEMEKQLEALKIEQANVIHANDIAHDQALLKIEEMKAAQERLQTFQRGAVESQIRSVEAAQDHHHKEQAHQHDIRRNQQQHYAEAARAQRQHEMAMEHARQTHDVKLEGLKATNEAKVQAAKAIAKAKPKPAAKPKAKKKD